MGHLDNHYDVLGKKANCMLSSSFDALGMRATGAMGRMDGSFDCATPTRSTPNTDSRLGLALSSSKLALPAPPALQTGIHTKQGVKPKAPLWKNQDSYLEKKLPGGLLLVGVFDGHGSHGATISSRVKNLFAELGSTFVFSTDLHGALQRTFTRVQLQIHSEGSCDHSGATATVALVDPSARKVSIAHVGDSTALLISPAGRIIFQSTDHKPTNEKEAVRLRAHGSQIVHGRLVPAGSTHSFGLARAIGDVAFSDQGVIAEPDISCDLPFELGSSLILASDGVWDMVAKEEATSMVLSSKPQEAAEQIVDRAQKGWAIAPHMDDITALIVKSVGGDATDSADMIGHSSKLDASTVSPSSTPSLGSISPVSPLGLRSDAGSPLLGIPGPRRQQMIAMF
jgi:serine/threonine protein phosphatase PrpC